MTFYVHRKANIKREPLYSMCDIQERVGYGEKSIRKAIAALGVQSSGDGIASHGRLNIALSDVNRIESWLKENISKRANQNLQ
jgi:hypothetical protein